MVSRFPLWMLWGPAGAHRRRFSTARLVRDQEAELTRRLRPGVSPEDCGSAFVLACAWMALAGLTAGESAGVERFTAGSLTIQEGGGADAAERSAALRLQAETVLGPYLADRGFAFQGVDG